MLIRSNFAALRLAFIRFRAHQAKSVFCKNCEISVYCTEIYNFSLCHFKCLKTSEFKILDNNFILKNHFKVIVYF